MSAVALKRCEKYPMHVRSGEMHIPDSTGNVERVIPFDDTNRKLGMPAAMPLDDAPN